MIDRRRILQSGLALTSVVATVSLTSARSAYAQAIEQALDHSSLYKVLFDQRFAASRDFGHEARMHGHAVQGFNGDITNVWYRDLHPRWKQGPAAIAGLTAHGALFCLERLAWDVGMRVTHRAELRYEGHEPLYTWVIAPRA